jgi:DNA-binding transcriptional LysR family regulator
MKLDPRHLVQLAAILDSGTLRAAAERLGTTQPALSRTIAVMEECIGTPLFERSRRPLTPTSIGVELAAFGRTIGSAIEQADGLSDQITAGKYGTIRVGAPPFFCDSLLSRMIGEFTAARPQVRVLLFSHYLPALFHEILNHRLDIVVGPFELLERKRDLKIERLLQSRHVIVCRPGHKLLRRRPVSVAELEAAAWIGHLGSSVLAADMRSTLTSIGVNHLDLVFESDSAGAVLTLVREGDYLTVLPLLSVVERIAAGEFAILSTRHRGPERAIGIITRASAAQNIALTELKNALRARIRAVVRLMDDIASRGDRTA